jgi:hypothetical protein
MVGNSGIDVWLLFHPWARFVVGERKEIVVALDWTDFDGDDHATLAGYLITNHGRATPLIWMTVPKSTAPSSDPATNYGTAGAGDCADGGDSCLVDPAEVAAKADCAPDGQHHRACLCAGAILYQCYINHGCYTPRIATSLTLEYLQKNLNDNNKGAAEFGTPCF